MRRRKATLLAALAAGGTALLALGAAAPGAAAATSSAGTGHYPSSRPLPQAVFAPYYEMYDTSTDLAALSQQSGAKYLSLAFLQTAAAGSCTAYWDGDTTKPIAPSSYGADIAAIQAHGGNVIPSFGGYTADTTNTDIADSCTSVADIAKVFESLITTYNVPRIDLDVEADSLTNTAGINRRNEAIALTEAWAAAHHRQIQFSYTLPTFPTGLTAAEYGRPAERRRRRRQDLHREPADVRLLLRHAAGHGGRHRGRRGRAVQPVAGAVPGDAGPRSSGT